MMIPTEHEWQVATDAAAKAYYDAHHPPNIVKYDWERLTVGTRNAYRQAVLPFLRPALEALPDRLEEVRQIYDAVDKDDNVAVGMFLAQLGLLLA